MKKRLIEESKEDLKEESKKERDQVLLRVDVEEKARLTSLGQGAGFPSAAQFVIAAMQRYGDILAKAIIAEDAEVKEVRRRHREALRGELNLPVDKPARR